MASKANDLQKKVLKLPPHERALLVRAILKSLEGQEEELDQAQFDQLWEIETQKRVDEFKSGKVKGIPAKDVFDEAYSKLQ